MSDPSDPSVWSQVFSPTSQAIAFFGGLGGLVHSLALKSSWKETIRVVAIGTIFPFCLGTVTPYFLNKFIGDVIPTELGPVLGMILASGFIVGLVATALVERILARVTTQGVSSK